MMMAVQLGWFAKKKKTKLNCTLEMVKLYDI